jgi:nickel/cobalt transporter (NiCoT) family protein
VSEANRIPVTEPAGFFDSSTGALLKRILTGNHRRGEQSALAVVSATLALIRHSWQMAPLGFLFGLGFDTTTKVMLLGLAGAQAVHGVSIGAILVFPALFAAGMALIDTTDGVLMLGAYQWAFVKPIRKLYYNMTITGVSALVAIIIGGIETMALIAHKLDLSRGGWKLASNLAEHFNALGFAIIGLFAAAWAASYFIYRSKRFDEIEVVDVSRNY